MPYLETPLELAECLADQLGIYNAHDERCTDERSCRPCWVSEMAERIREAGKNERKLGAVGLV